MTTSPTTAPLTAEDIADIAGYYGLVWCEYELTPIYRDFEDWREEKGILNGEILQDLSGRRGCVRVRNFQLHLKDLRHLTPDDVRAMAGLLMCEGEGEIYRASGHIYFQSETDFFSINETTGSIHQRIEGVGTHFANNMEVIRYAMRKGYFVPGSVRVELVKLIE